MSFFFWFFQFHISSTNLFSVNDESSLLIFALMHGSIRSILVHRVIRLAFVVLFIIVTSKIRIELVALCVNLQFGNYTHFLNCQIGYAEIILKVYALQILFGFEACFKKLIQHLEFLLCCNYSFICHFIYSLQSLTGGLIKPPVV